MNILQKLSNHIESLFDTKIISIHPLSGGDINNVYRLDVTDSTAVIKLNDANQFPGMFATEAIGLQMLAEHSAFTIPKVLFEGEVESQSYLIIEHIDSANKTADFWKDFGHKLAYLHQQSAPYFGLEKDNYIGSLPQSNSKETNAVDFYIRQRIQPQIALAGEKGYDFTKISSFYKNIETIIPDEASSLIHGDLWGGNYMVDDQGQPCLIDPAVTYVPREMDIAMMHLFGGFDPTVFDIYNEAFPLESGWKGRIELWQLYYLLVHLNLFGSSYFDSINSIINRYT